MKHFHCLLVFMQFLIAVRQFFIKISHLLLIRASRKHLLFTRFKDIDALFYFTPLQKEKRNIVIIIQVPAAMLPVVLCRLHSLLITVRLLITVKQTLPQVLMIGKNPQSVKTAFNGPLIISLLETAFRHSNISFGRSILFLHGFYGFPERFIRFLKLSVFLISISDIF